MLTSTDTVSEAKQSRRTHYVQDALLGVLPIIFCIQFLGWLTFFPNALRGHADFRQLYVAGYMVRTGHRTQLYDYAEQTYLQNMLVSVEQDREFVRGLLIGLCLFKFQIVTPIVLLFLLWRRWRFAKGFAASAMLVSLLSLLTIGWSQSVVFGRSLLSVGAGLPGATGAINFPLRITIMANLRGLIYGLASSRAP